MAYEELASSGIILFSIFILVLWSSIWKGIALWKSARHKQLAWFVVLFIINTAGILEIIYLLFFQRKIPQKIPKPIQATKPIKIKQGKIQIKKKKVKN